MSREDPQLKIRLPAELKNAIELAAKANNRSMNAEIVARLEASFAPPSDDLVARFDQLMEARQARLLDELKASVQKMLNRDEPADKKR